MFMDINIVLCRIFVSRIRLLCKARLGVEGEGWEDKDATPEQGKWSGVSDADQCQPQHASHQPQLWWWGWGCSSIMQEWRISEVHGWAWTYHQQSSGKDEGWGSWLKHSSWAKEGGPGSCFFVPPSPPRKKMIAFTFSAPLLMILPFPHYSLLFHCQVFFCSSEGDCS